jgi:membrane-bound ClpP family serine protease
MKLLLLLAILIAAAGLAATLVIGLYVHKRKSAGDIRLIGELGHADTALDPEGTVIVGGELWRAKSKTGTAISARSRVRVVAFVGHLALVEACD